jgi:cell division protein FtsW (lipid II flippase)
LLVSAWVLLSAAVTLVAGGVLVASISESSYDATENRAPEARIAVSAIATVVGLVAVTVAVQRLRGREGRLGTLAGLVLATVLLIALEGIITLASGRT